MENQCNPGWNWEYNKFHEIINPLNPFNRSAKSFNPSHLRLFLEIKNKSIFFVQFLEAGIKLHVALFILDLTYKINGIRRVTFDGVSFFSGYSFRIEQVGITY